MQRLTTENTVVVLIDWQERLVAAMPERIEQQNLAKAVTLVSGARAAGIPILASEQYPKGLGRTVAPLLDALGEGFEFVEKRAFSCTDVPEFMEALRATGRDRVVVVGMESHVCVLQTVRGLVEAGYTVQVPLDGVVSRFASDFAVAVDLYRQLGATVTSVETVLFDVVRRAEGELFKTVSRLVR
jgi:nicotinamidase-related amidase